MCKFDKNDNTHNSILSSKIGFQEIQDQIDKIEILLKKTVIQYQSVSAEELNNYFDDIPPSGDETTLFDVLNNQWLLIHELIELSELKRINLKISSQLLKTHPVEVDYAHITATEYELKFAKDGNDHNWISMRLKDINAWFEDEMMPIDLRARCSKLIKDFS
jgi:hypothetical protein